MNADKLVKAIQMLVREEIKATLPQMVNEAVKQHITNMINEQASVVDKTNKQRNAQRSVKQERSMPKKKKQRSMNEQRKANNNVRNYSSNPVINEILNETTPFSGQDRNPGGMSTMAFTSNDVNMFSGNQANTQYEEYDDNKQEGLGVNTGVPKIDAALNRNYADLMKAIDQKKGK